jgi:hypothetical protein
MAETRVRNLSRQPDLFRFCHKTIGGLRMKKILIATLAILLLLTACTAPEAEPQTTALPPTEEVAPTATDEPTAEPTATDEPEPTDTAEPTATTEVESTRDPVGTLPEDFEFPEGAAVVFTQMGGFAGFDNTWVIYEDGRVTLNGEDRTAMTADEVDTLQSDLDELGFFGIEYLTKPGEFCCDFIEYTLAVQYDGQQNFVSFSEGDQNLPENLWEALFLMQAVTEKANLR